MKGKFQKGKSGNPAGRPKGSGNKLPAEQRALIGDVLHENADKFRAAMKAAKGALFLRMYLEALQYTTPKLKAIEYREVPELEAFLRMSHEERIAEIERLRGLLNDNSTDNGQSTD